MVFVSLLPLAGQMTIKMSYSHNNICLIEIFDCNFENNNFLDPDQLVLQSQLPQNPDPEADPKIVFHCLP